MPLRVGCAASVRSRSDGRTDESTLQAGIVAVTSVAFNRGAQIPAGEEPARGSNDCPEDLPPEASFRPRVSSVLRAQHPGRSAAGAKSWDVSQAGRCWIV